MTQLVSLSQTNKDERSAILARPCSSLARVLAGKIHVVQLAGLFLVFALLYAPTLASLVELWWTHDDHSYGFLVPLVSLYLIFRRGEALRRSSFRPRSEEHTSELQSLRHLVCRLLLAK